MVVNNFSSGSFWFLQGKENKNINAMSKLCILSKTLPRECLGLEQRKQKIVLLSSKGINLQLIRVGGVILIALDNNVL